MYRFCRFLVGIFGVCMFSYIASRGLGGYLDVLCGFVGYFAFLIWRYLGKTCMLVLRVFVGREIKG
jgi:hypothetical protein